MTPLHLGAGRGHTDVTKVLLEAGASLSAMNNEVIKHSVKLIQSNIKLFK
jgi:ankyrin repeat protein